jgi:hypothetical protein
VDTSLQTIERAYELAASGKCASVKHIKDRLSAEGHAFVLTHLRSRLLVRELRELCDRCFPVDQVAVGPLAPL